MNSNTLYKSAAWNFPLHFCCRTHSKRPKSQKGVWRTDVYEKKNIDISYTFIKLRTVNLWKNNEIMILKPRGAVCTHTQCMIYYVRREWANWIECCCIGNGTVRRKKVLCCCCVVSIVHFLTSTFPELYRSAGIVMPMCKCKCRQAEICICVNDAFGKFPRCYFGRERKKESVESILHIACPCIFDCVDHMILWLLDQIAKWNETRRNGQQNHHYLPQ